MIRQCAGCGTCLLPERRSELCPSCWLDYQRQRNREKVRAFRARQRIEVAPPAPSDQNRLPTADEFQWLDGLDLGLAVPVSQASNLLDEGRGTDDPEVRELLVSMLARYDALRADFESRAASIPDPEDRAGGWRWFFESVRRVYQ